MALPWLLFCLGWFNVPIHAGEALDQADYSQPWQVISYAKETGLSQQRAFDITFTPAGDAWLAADSGLYRFDGFAWTRFGTNDGLPSSFLRAVYVDIDGRLWVGSDAGAGEWDYTDRKYNPHGSQNGLANSNVREIDQDSDGKFWFSCDQWPETGGKPGGLTSYNPRSNHWKTYRQTNGLPMDYVIGYFHSSSNQFALTPHGWVEKDKAEGWHPPVDPGYEVEDCVLQMAEARDGTLFAQGEHTLLTRNKGLWQSHPESRTRLLCTTRAGQVAAVECETDRGRLWFSLWNGQQFVRASAIVPYSGRRLYHLREAPDGALWCVGSGTLIRWTWGSGKWTLYPHLPPPVGTDAQGRVWYAGGTNLAIYAAGHYLPLAPGHLRAWSDTGQALISDVSQNELLLVDPQYPDRRTLVETGCQLVDQAFPDTGGGFWILGRDTNNNGVVTHYKNGKASILAPPEFAGRQLTAGNPESPEQILLVAHSRGNNRYEVARVTEQKITWLPFVPAPPPVTYPNVLIAAGRCWLQGYSGLYEQSVLAPEKWQPVTAFPYGGLLTSLSSSKELFVVFSSGSLSCSGCALYYSNRWVWTAGEFAKPTYGLDKITAYLPSRGGVYIRRQQGTLDTEFLQIPEDIMVNNVADDPAGNLWLSTEEGTLRYQPSHTPPLTKATASTLEIREGTPLPVELRGRSRFEPPKDATAYRYSWRVDQGPWSSFEPWPGPSLRLPGLGSGPHALEVRARDVDGNVATTPALVKFTILSEPLQNQPWFLPAVGLLALALAWLVWLSLTHIREIAQANAVLSKEIAVRRHTETELERARAELEQRVKERTTQLTEANQQLLHEITERKQAEEHQRRLEQQLHQAQKMEAIGTLAGGIAHDFNNILAVIIPYCELVIQDIPGRPDLQEHMHEVLKAANRAKQLVQQILTFSHQGASQQRQLCELQPVIKEAMAMLRFVLPSSLELQLKIKPVRPVLANPTQIHQVLMNLCVNAQHAMEGRQGQLEVGLDELQVDGALCERNRDLRPGLYVRIRVRDTGCGISPENLDRIFDPFFTTKGIGKGTGLGLAVVQGIVRSHDGAVLVESQPGQGSEFQILLPAQAEAVKESPTVPAPPPRARGERLLIVDDEVGIIKVLKRVLDRAGFQVSAHTDPRDALVAFIARPKEVDLVFSDLTMPGMNGLELAEKIGEIRPELPIIITSGFAGTLITPEELAAHPNIRQTVEKPVSPDNILRLITEVLKSSQPESSDKAA